MRNNKRKLGAVILLAMAVTGLQAQVVKPTSGGNTTGTGGSAIYSTIGQVVYTSNTGTSVLLTQDLKQPFKISSIATWIEQPKGPSFPCLIFPNPTNDFLTVKIEGEQLMKYSVSLYDSNGKLLRNTNIKSDETKIDLRNLASANYFVKVLNNGKLVKTFKIIKN
jgi:hypothetical protein